MEGSRYEIFGIGKDPGGVSCRIVDIEVARDKTGAVNVLKGNLRWNGAGVVWAHAGVNVGNSKFACRGAKAPIRGMYV